MTRNEFGVWEVLVKQEIPDDSKVKVRTYLLRVRCMICKTRILMSIFSRSLLNITQVRDLTVSLHGLSVLFKSQNHMSTMPYIPKKSPLNGNTNLPRNLIT